MAEDKKEDKKDAKESIRFEGSRQWIGSGWDLEKPATSRPSRKE